MPAALKSHGFVALHPHFVNHDNYIEYTDLEWAEQHPWLLPGRSYPFDVSQGWRRILKALLLTSQQSFIFPRFVEINYCFSLASPRPLPRVLPVVYQNQPALSCSIATTPAFDTPPRELGMFPAEENL